MTLMRRKPGTLIPIERSILAAAMQLRSQGTKEFHGFQIAKEVQVQRSARLLTGHGTLYRALGRLEQQGLLASRWEDPEIAVQQHRPRRRFYELTSPGEAAASSEPVQTSDLRPSTWRTATP